MGNAQSSAQKINYEDIQYVLKNSESHVLINTLNENEQTCLIPNTIHINQEEEIINRLIKNGNKNVKIIIYGKNCNDEKLYKKYSQLISLGFHSVYIYTGGMFEWLLLQDIYSSSEFPTTKKELDLLLFKPPKVLTICLLEYH
jgi:23S rRNA pseudoU1915 N3-methylase RlmH